MVLPRLGSRNRRELERTYFLIDELPSNTVTLTRCQVMYARLLAARQIFTPDALLANVEQFDCVW
jgi:hypothetical protein